MSSSQSSERGANTGRDVKAGRDSRPRQQPRRLRRVEETSAGGLVVDIRDGILVGALIGRIDRKGRLAWSLPKGHLEEGETAEDAAMREVEEETGIAGEILGRLGSVDYWFIADEKRIHKTVHHFLLRAVSGELSDADIEVTEVAWVPLQDITDRLAHADERELVASAGRLLAESA